MANNRQLVSAPAASVISNDSGGNIAEVLQAPPVSGTDWGLAVHANLGSQIIPVAQELQGAANFATGQAALNSSTATSLMSARPTRRCALVTNTSATVNIYVGGAAVATSTGQLIAPGNSLTIPFTGAIYAISASSTPTASYCEAYD